MPCLILFQLLSSLFQLTASNTTQSYYSHAHYASAYDHIQLAETLLTVPGLVDASTGRMRGRLIPSQFESKKASELKTDEYNLGE